MQFGSELIEDCTQANVVGAVDKMRIFWIGIVWGPFVTMGPHTVSRHVDYFGSIGERIMGGGLL